jgi:hypothetical protein
MKKIVNKLIDESVKGVDTYSHNGSTWLIFTESKQWVIELTESKTLWYNYNFFKGMFAYTSMDVVENQHYITQWVEDNIINKVKDTILEQNITEGEVEGIIEMAVKENSFSFVRMKVDCENVIENGVKETNKSLRIDGSLVIEDTIQNGVRDISPMTQYTDWQVEEIIENGVKDTQLHKGIRPSSVEHTIENGVKLTGRIHKDYTKVVEHLIKNGVKKTGPIQHKYMVEDIIENGVRHTLNTEYMPKTMVEDIIENGELKTSSRNLEQFGQGYSLWKTETVINEGVKETKEMDEWVNTPRIVGDVIENGVKETKTPGNGDIASTAEWMKENNSTSYPKMIDDVIENGVKEIRPSGCVDPKTGIFHYRIQEQVDDVVDNGVKEIKTPNKDGDIKSTLEWMYKNNYQDDYNGSKMINNVIENGVKETQPLPDQSGELIGYGNYYHGKEDRTKPFIDYLEDTIKFGIKN